MSTMFTENGCTTVKFSDKRFDTEVTTYGDTDWVRVRQAAGPNEGAATLMFRTGNPGVAAKLAQQFAEAARAQGYTGDLNF